VRPARTRILAAFAAIGLLMGLAMISGAPSAHAATAQTYGIVGPPVCNGNGFGDCLNDWGGGGNGNPVDMYGAESNLNNEEFQIILEPDRCGGAESDSCPFANKSIDEEEYNEDGGGLVVAIEDTSNGECVGTATNGDAILGSCPVDGSGGAAGNIFVYSPDDFLYSNYWTNSLNELLCVTGSDTNGAPVELYQQVCQAWNTGP
jgi:hypothetical protein